MNIEIKNLKDNIDKLIDNCKLMCGHCLSCSQRKECNQFCKETEYYLESEQKPKDLAWIEVERMKQILYK